MGVVSRFRDWLSAPRRLTRSERIRAHYQAAYHRIKARYDAAQTNDENKNHWINADDLSARAANTWAVRNKLRRRARYERDNNSFCKGIVTTYANEVVGTTPRLQLQTGSEQANRVIEREFAAWSDAIDLAGKLRLLYQSRLVDGEGFWRLADNPGNSTPVTLDLRPFEADQCASYYQQLGKLNEVDGIRFDPHGNPAIYYVLPHHPGGENDLGHVTEFVPEEIPASQIVHFFRCDRPGQARGVPDITPAIPLFAQLRRYTLAVLMAAELTAELAVILKTDLPPGGAAEPFEAQELFDVQRGMIQTMPAGWEPHQLNPGQPSTGYGEFCDRILKEIGRCLNMPYGISAGDSSNYNYASGRLDVQTWQRLVKIERHTTGRVLNRVLNAWLAEAVLIPGYLPAAGLPPYGQWRRTWFFDGFEHVDPLKEAAAIATLLDKHAITLEHVYASRGQDWVEMVAQSAREAKELAAAGLLPGAAAPMPAPPPPNPFAEDAEVPNAAA